MPISKNGKQYYTEEMLEKALNSNYSPLEYAQTRGYKIKKVGSVWQMTEHDSLIFFPNGSWHWYSTGKGGDVLAFITQYEERSFKDAVLILNGEAPIATSAMPIKKLADSPAVEPPQETEKTPFILPTKKSDNKRLFAYLLKSRCIDSSIASDLVRTNKIYLSSYTTSKGKEMNNIVFVGFDENGVSKSGF